MVSGTWTISYHFTPCVGGAWSPFGTNGGGFANPGPMASDPIVSSGSSICITLTSTAGLGSTASGMGGTACTAGSCDVYARVDTDPTHLAPCPSATGPCFLFTAPFGSGGGTGSFAWMNSVLGSGTSICTAPILVAVVPAGTSPVMNDFNGNVADHLILATSSGTLCAAAVPEFSAPIAAMFTALAPIVFLFKRRKL